MSYFIQFLQEWLDSGPIPVDSCGFRSHSWGFLRILEGICGAVKSTAIFDHRITTLFHNNPPRIFDPSPSVYGHHHTLLTPYYALLTPHYTFFEHPSPTYTTLVHNDDDCHVAPQPNDTQPLPWTARYENKDEQERTNNDDTGSRCNTSWALGVFFFYFFSILY